MMYFCCDDERRRNAIQAHPTLNGIDFLEVFDDPTAPFAERQRTLFVHFVEKNTIQGQANLRQALEDLTIDDVTISGGERIQGIKVLSLSTAATLSPPLSPPTSPPSLADNVLVVSVSAAGDFSTYTLRVRNPASSPPGTVIFDPILSAVDFSFKVSCPSDFDCQVKLVCPPGTGTTAEFDYLAKDYDSFRRLMLDRMSALMPNWKERNPADLGIALVELLAYVGDYLSYQQDAVATESYLGTARRRSSVRRHVRLVDYPMHDGRNARTFVHLRVAEDVDGLQIVKGVGQDKTKFLTRLPVDTVVFRQDSAALTEALRSHPQVFELLDDLSLYEAHNEIRFYSWEARECCLPKGATRATLRDNEQAAQRLKLRTGDYLVFEERLGPETGAAADADPARRHAVRLSHVEPEADIDDEKVRTAGPILRDPLTNEPVVNIEWSIADALPFPLCISNRDETLFFEDVTVALGNIALTDHGMTFDDRTATSLADPTETPSSLEPDTVPQPKAVLTVVSAAADRCQNGVGTPLTPQRYRPRLLQAPLTQAAPYDPKNPPASANELLQTSITGPNQFPKPALQLFDEEPGSWDPVRDLLSSNPTSREFVVEVESDGTAYLRFGDSQLGVRPAPDTKFLVTYRIGNGLAGNVGRDTLGHIVSPQVLDSLILQVRNPLPASGGLEQETIEEVRQKAPSAFRTQERAVTPLDYADVASRCSADIQRAAATFRWTGSWRTVFLTVDRFGGRKVDDAFENDLRGCLETFRMAGHDLEVNGPQYVSLELEMVICVKPNYFASNVKAALLELFSNRRLPDGRTGVFHPDNFTFGQPVFLSSLIAAAQAVTGVDSVDVTTFQRQGTDSQEALLTGKLDLGRLEIARLDNDPNFPEHGVFVPVMRGGR